MTDTTETVSSTLKEGLSVSTDSNSMPKGLTSFVRRAPFGELTSAASTSTNDGWTRHTFNSFLFRAAGLNFKFKMARQGVFLTSLAVRSAASVLLSGIRYGLATFVWNTFKGEHLSTECFVTILAMTFLTMNVTIGVPAEPETPVPSAPLTETNANVLLFAPEPNMEERDNLSMSLHRRPVLADVKTD